jgi:NADH-quinone oxidoreductase subunit L
MAVTVLLAPLLGAIIAGLFWRVIGERPAQIVATGLLFLSAFLSWVIFLTHDGSVQQITLMRWIDSGSLVADWAIRLDRLTAVMLIVITTVSALVHLYSFGYMAHDDNFAENESYRPRFFAYLSLFTFAMLMLVTADNMVQLFFGWEGVGLASYLLIGFYFRKQSAGAAAMKAFIVNRVGDMGLILALMALFFLVDSVQYDDIFAAAPLLAETTVSFLWTEWNAANLIAFLLFVGAMGKSAQLLLHTWLPDAMEGPTPVSALIHAATMVTAGVFLLARMSPLMEYTPDVLSIRGADRRADRVFRRNCWSGAKRYQARDRLFHLFAAGFHVRGDWRGCLFGGDVPPADSCVLQGHAVSGCGVCHSWHAPRTGHAQLWRLER